MKQQPWGTLVLLFISLLLYCCGNGSEIIGQDDDIGNLINAKVLRSIENIHVGKHGLNTDVGFKGIVPIPIVDSFGSLVG